MRNASRSSELSFARSQNAGPGPLDTDNGYDPAGAFAYPFTLRQPRVASTGEYTALATSWRGTAFNLGALAVFLRRDALTRGPGIVLHVDQQPSRDVLTIGPAIEIRGPWKASSWRALSDRGHPRRLDGGTFSGIKHDHHEPSPAPDQGGSNAD